MWTTPDDAPDTCLLSTSVAAPSDPLPVPQHALQCPPMQPVWVSGVSLAAVIESSVDTHVVDLVIIDVGESTTSVLEGLRSAASRVKVVVVRVASNSMLRRVSHVLLEEMGFHLEDVVGPDDVFVTRHP
eukprot:CAMPEP_0175991262 /NCGR_PEP_ID=MMETSP0108-20121206/52755_1 /TAXON_ID=195067 ORGANISM="Goniomonas pacifica, Strain CCMP1869" /NCGR_SAMPLE_ID=MMETSP0108 /ASSEMBLY_ACC=CAM_ASM_000204 /LENGTH=128 /DNA_ID=CAMNT_0017322807 /DNA_START=298 /DNA_END=684 /DNA_ORIENTATION=-